MTALSIIFLLTGGVGVLSLLLFGLTSLTERKLRAATLSFLLGVSLGFVWYGGYYLLQPPDWLLLVFLSLTVSSAILCFAPLGKRRPMQIGEVTERVDERDIMFAREEYQPGTERYQEYYTRHPEKQKIDDKIRKLPELLKPGGRFYDPVRSAYIDSIFAVNRRLTAMVDGEPAAQPIEVEPAEITLRVKEFIRHLGADEVGVAPLNPAWVYSHVGRGAEPWGTPITNIHQYAIAFTLEMDYHHVETAPRLPITEETAVQYLRAAKISITLAEFIRRLGYPARAHIAGSDYQIMLPPVAYDAGLGELGRFGYLISPRFGARVRLGAVTTDLPLTPDQPIEFGVQDFCDKCKKCATNCPSRSIPAGAKTKVRGVEKWQLEMESCLHYWRVVGTDCGLCMKVCPFSHPPTFFHNLMRLGIGRSVLARRLAVWGDDLFYGKKMKV